MSSRRSGLSMLLYILTCLLSAWPSCSSILEEEFRGNNAPSIFLQDNHVSLHRQKRADERSYEIQIEFEISFPETRMATDVEGFMKNVNYSEVLNVTVLSLNVSNPVVNPSISVYPNTSNLYQGDNVTIYCKFGDNNTVFWYLNNRLLSFEQRYSKSSSWEGIQFQYTLTIPDFTDADKGTYTCTLNNTRIQNTSSIAINDVKKLLIDRSPITDTFCNDTLIFNLTCCSASIGEFNVSWSRNDTTENLVAESRSGSCSIYTLRATTPERIIQYNCTFKRNEGATFSESILVYYIRRTNVSVYPASPVLITTGRLLRVDCTADSNYTKIHWINSVTGNSVSESNLLQAPQVTSQWNGVYTCVVYQRSLNTSRSVSVEVVPLPDPERVTVNQTVYMKAIPGCNQIPVQCCITDSRFYVSFKEDTAITPVTSRPGSSCYEYVIKHNCEPQNFIVTCVVSNRLGGSVTKDMNISFYRVTAQSRGCLADSSKLLPDAPDGALQAVPCNIVDPKLLGTKNYTCKNGDWSEPEDGCYSAKILETLTNVKDVVNGPEVAQNLPNLLQVVSNSAKEEKENIGNSIKNLELMVNVISTISESNVTVNSTMMTDFIKTVGIVVDQSPAWKQANKESVKILESVEVFAKNLQLNDTIDTTSDPKQNIQLFGKPITKDDFAGNFSLLNLSSNVFIGNGAFPPNAGTVITITYGTMDNLPTNSTKSVNGLVMSTVFGKNVPTDKTFNITMTFEKTNNSLVDPDCVWYNVTRKDWDNSGCTITKDSELVTCSCNHLTSFSILMGGKPNPMNVASETISYIGLGISLGSLVITLIIERMVWTSVIKNKTSYLRHVCLVNIAVTLLAADIWFFIARALENNLSQSSVSDACKAATFFTFFFYLSLFFWMLTTGLVLFYRMIYIFHDMSRRKMMIIAFSIGYGCPLLISIITVASTEPRKNFTILNYCWLNVDQSKAFLAFVVPALSIVFINLVIFGVVVYKLMRPAVGERLGQEEKKVLIVITKTIFVLTPLLGITWLFGLLVVVSPENDAFDIIFTTLNSLQGLFILISTVLLDQKVRTAVRSSISSSYFNTFRSRIQTSSDSSASSKSKENEKKRRSLKKRFFGRKAVYNFNNGESSTETSGNSYSMLS